jgi:outer membrane protein OmpA-like peptidoglycan-associated protein
MKRLIVMIAVLAVVVGSIGCGMTRTQKGAVIGTTTGAAVGAVVGNAAGNTAVGAIVGAAVGGAAGTYIGHYMDQQAAEIEQDLEGARVERIGEGIKITFNSGIMFDVNKANLRPEAQQNLGDLAGILNKYPDTNVLIEGHTDSDGTEEHNLELSRQRAQSVSNYLAGRQVDATRFTIMGYGESQPIATNDTTEGKQLNRRVELAIMANDKLKKVAQERTG